MSLRSQLLTLSMAALGALLVFHLLHRQLLGVLPAQGASDEVIAALLRSQEDLKRLARADAAHRDDYHARFEALQSLSNRLRIVSHNRERIASRQQALVLASVLVTIVVFGATLLVGARRDARRLRRVRQALASLAGGERGLRLADQGRDHIGAVARMIEDASDAIARDRQRLASLRHLASWQEAARRQAHELRTPLTVARLELERLAAALGDAPAEPALRSVEELRSELRRIGDFVQRFASFARLPEPDRQPLDLRELLREFLATFGDAWAGVRLEAALPAMACSVRVDRAMMRQVLVNLCDNSARAMAGRPGTIIFSLRPAGDSGWMALDVADDGPGVPADVRERVFEPYVTTAPPGEGVGLGLAISRKILLDHGGDLELVDSTSGATFRVLLPSEAA